MKNKMNNVLKKRVDLKYSTGDTVKFKLRSGEIQKGEVFFVENSHSGDVLYINGFNRLAYRINKKCVISQS